MEKSLGYILIIEVSFYFFSFSSHDYIRSQSFHIPALLDICTNGMCMDVSTSLCCLKITWRRRRSQRNFVDISQFLCGTGSQCSHHQWRSMYTTITYRSTSKPTRATNPIMKPHTAHIPMTTISPNITIRSWASEAFCRLSAVIRPNTHSNAKINCNKNWKQILDWKNKVFDHISWDPQ